MRKILRFPAMLAAALVIAGTARADVIARVDLSAQRMTVSVDGETRYVWPVSTARDGYVTPTGTYRPIRMERVWYSRKYHMSPMPYAIFFLGGYAVHGTNEAGAIGMPVSHGCVRLHTGNARTLFHLVQEYGLGRSRIVIAQGGGPFDSYQDRYRNRFEPYRSRYNRPPVEDDDDEPEDNQPRRFFFPFFGPNS